MACGVTVGLPSVDRYLDLLPGGLSAYPECLHKGEPLGVWLDRSPTSGLADRAPAPLAALLDRRRALPTWVPDVHACVLFLAMRDVYFDSDDAFLAHASRVNRAVLDTPTNRVLFWVGAPKAILRGAGLRWGSLHRGTTFETRLRGDFGAQVDIGFPPNLFPRLVLLGNGTGFKAALENAGARKVVVNLEIYEPTRAHFTATWD
jgi:hypothetical protein